MDSIQNYGVKAYSPSFKGYDIESIQDDLRNRRIPNDSVIAEIQTDTDKLSKSKNIDDILKALDLAGILTAIGKLKTEGCKAELNFKLQLLNMKLITAKPEEKEGINQEIAKCQAAIERINQPATNKHGLKCSKNLTDLTAMQKSLFEDAAKELESNKNVDLLCYNIGWGSYIHPASNPNLYLSVKFDDFTKMTDINAEISRLSGEDGTFEFSVLGSDKKAQVIIPNEELTDNMKYITEAIQAGIHPFLIDMAKYLDKHPEKIEEIEKNIGEIDLSKVDSKTMQRIEDCK